MQRGVFFPVIFLYYVQDVPSVWFTLIGLVVLDDLTSFLAALKT